jgi:hypothetical protein
MEVINNIRNRRWLTSYLEWKWKTQIEKRGKERVLRVLCWVCVGDWRGQFQTFSAGVEVGRVFSSPNFSLFSFPKERLKKAKYFFFMVQWLKCPFAMTNDFILKIINKKFSSTISITIYNCFYFWANF